MKRAYRLTRSADFDRVRRRGESYAHPLLVLIVLRNETTFTRIGVAAGKTIGSAVRRNRAKRLLRAAGTSLLPRMKSGWDILLLARRPLSEEKSTAVEAALLSLLRRAGLLAGNEATT